VIQKLVWENVKHRPLRTLLSALLIAIPVTLVLTLTGLSKGMIDDNNRRSRGVGGDIIIRPKGSSLLDLGRAGMPEGVVGFIEKQPHITIATGIVVQSLGTPFTSAAGIDLKKFNQMSGGFVYKSGGPFRGPHEVVVDEFHANQNKIRTGDTIELWNQKWRVSGIVEPGKLNRVFLDLRTLQELTGSANRVYVIYAKVDDPKNIETVIANLKAQMEGYPIYSMEEFTSAFTFDNIPLLARFTSVMIGISIFIGFAVVCLSMYMAVLQRTREIGILKSLGASRWYVLSIILREAVMLAVAGTALGIGMSYGAKWLLQTFVPAMFPPAIDPSWWPAAAAIALAGAVLGALYPGWRAAQMDPIEALSYE
jgi:putative ABC transport system permease protein